MTLRIHVVNFNLYFAGNTKALLQGKFPPETMKLVFTEDKKEIATYFSADGKGTLTIID